MVIVPEYTPKLNLPLPVGTDAVSRANHRALVEAIDAAAVAETREVTTTEGLTGGGNLGQNRTLGIADGGVTDAKIGNRTVNPALPNPANTGPLTSLLSWIVGRIRAITGKSNWYDAPAITLEQASTRLTDVEAAATGAQATADEALADAATAQATAEAAQTAATNAQASATASYDNATEDALVVESVLPVDLEEPDQVQTSKGPAVEFANSVTKSVIFTRRWPWAGKALKVELVIAADAANAGTFRIRVSYRVNGGTESSVNANVTPGANNNFYTADLGQIIAAGSLPQGATVTLKISRLGADANDTHTGKMQLYHLRLRKV